MDVFNNREIAILIWAILFLGWCLSQDKIRSSLKTVIKAAFSRLLLKVYGAMLLYIFAMIYCLHEMAIWEHGQTKNTVIWIFSVALISLFRSNSIMEDPHYFRTAIKDNLNLIIVLEFILTFYTFNLFGELILVPVGAIFGGMKALTEGKAEHEIVDRFLSRIFIAFGIFIIGNAVYNLAQGFTEFATTETLADFYTPPLLSLLYLPFVYVLSLYSTYERVFIRIKFKCSEDDILKYVKWKSMLAFHFRVRLLDRWANATFFPQLTSKGEVRKSIKDIKALVAYEKNPKIIPVEEGWSPYEAKEFLSEHGLTTGYYKSIGDPEWFATSNDLDVGENVLPNYINYNISGDRYAARSLKLKINMHNPEHGNEAVDHFVELAGILLDKALGAEISDDLKSVIQLGQDATGTFENKTISVSRENWPNHANGGFDLSFAISA